MTSKSGCPKCGERAIQVQTTGRGGDAINGKLAIVLHARRASGWRRRPCTVRVTLEEYRAIVKGTPEYRRLRRAA